MQRHLQNKLMAALQPEHLAVVDETTQHNVPPDAESHFKVLIVSPQFEGMSLLKRHQTVNAVLKAELQQIHALALHTMTPEEWFNKAGQAPHSPPCLGGQDD